ncbi:MAG: acetate--CoA ligase family protein [Desulfobacteraceae bacterium]|nr:acetate--CoA ligase family protein [Desulfobacteraceae bacterium]
MILPEHEANRLLSDAGIPVMALAVATGPESAREAAGRLGFPVALKLSSAKYTHKSEIGGIRLNLNNADEVSGAYAELDSLRNSLDPEAGIIVEAMAPKGAELFVGYQRHEQFGPVVSVGLGGVFLELTGDVAFRLLPAKRADLREMLQELKSWPKLNRGFRSIPPANEDHLLNLIECVAKFALSRKELAELDLNPVIVTPDGAWAADARIVLDS